MLSRRLLIWFKITFKSEQEGFILNVYTRCPVNSRWPLDCRLYKFLQNCCCIIIIVFSAYKAKPLYELLLESLQDMLGTKGSTEEFQKDETTQSISLFTPQIQQQMKIKGIYDPLLIINFETIFTACLENLEKSSLENTTNDM